MKLVAKILTIIIYLQCSSIIGQTNVLVEDNKSWNILNYNPSQGPNAIRRTYEIRLEGDSIIDGIEYKVVRQSAFGIPQNFWATVGFIREDSNKVYFRNYLNENLLYDFNVSVGQRVEVVCPYINPHTLHFEFFYYLDLVVVSIDSVETNGGLKKRVKLRPFCIETYETSWIEGIGDLSGLLNNGLSGIICHGDTIGWGTGGAINDLLCCKKDSFLLYKQPVYNTCYYSNVGIEQPDIKNIITNLYPNPIVDNSIFEISTLVPGTKQLEIYTIAGRKIRTIDININENKVKIAGNEFLPGFYTYKLIINKDIIKIGKFVVE